MPFAWSVPRALLAAAALVFVVHLAAWPLSSGRTGAIALLYYFDFWNRDPVLPALVGYPPLAPFVFGWSLTALGGYATELLLGVSFVAAIWFTYRSGAIWGARTGLTVAAALLLHASYGSLFHRIDPDAFFATAFAAWLCYALSNARTHTVRVYAIHGLMVALLALIRPSNQIFLAFVVYPLGFSARSLSRRVVCAGAFVLAAGSLLGGWAVVNKARFGEFGSRFTNAAPLYGLMLNTRIVGPENGPASAALAEAVQQELLIDERYASRGIDVQGFFRDGGSRAWEALLALSDRRWGWVSKYRILRDVAMEAIRQNPGEYSLAITSTFVHTFILRHSFPVQWPDVGNESTTEIDSTVSRGAPPAEISWTDVRPHARPVLGADLDRAAALYRNNQELNARVFGFRHGIPAVARVINAVGKLFVPMIAVLAVALLGLPFLAVRGETKAVETVLVLMLLMAIGLLVLSSALQPATLEYRLPLDPLFLLAALIGGRALVKGRKVLRVAAP